MSFWNNTTSFLLAQLSDADLDMVCSNRSLLSSSHSHSLTDSDLLAPNRRPSPIQVWGIGLSFVTAISLCALVGIGIMPFLSKRLYSRVITYFVGLGVGSLSGSAIFHLLPQAFGLISSTGEIDHGYLMKAWAAIGGIYLFFFADKLLKFILEFKKKRKAECEMAELERSNRSSAVGSESSNADALLILGNKTARPSHCHGNGIRREPPTEQETAASLNRQAHGICVHDHDLDYKEGDSVIATVAWMIIFGDGLHNLIDGLSIGASFSDSILGGVSVSLAVLCEEFPHELGDVAILVSAGMTLRQALLYNLLSATSCYIGFVIGVALGNIDDTIASYIFGFAGGMFLYISLASMVPEMKSAMETEMAVKMSKGLEVLVLQAAGLISGLTLMSVMARYGGEISFE